MSVILLLLFVLGIILLVVGIVKKNKMIKLSGFVCLLPLIIFLLLWMSPFNKM